MGKKNGKIKKQIFGISWGFGDKNIIQDQKNNLYFGKINSISKKSRNWISGKMNLILIR